MKKIMMLIVLSAFLYSFAYCMSNAPISSESLTQTSEASYSKLTTSEAVLATREASVSTIEARQVKNKIEVAIVYESVPYCQKVKTIYLNIFNNRISTPIIIDPKRITLKDTEMSLLKSMHPDEIVALLDIKIKQNDSMIKLFQISLTQNQQDQMQAQRTEQAQQVQQPQKKYSIHYDALGRPYQVEEEPSYVNPFAVLMEWNNQAGSNNKENDIREAQSAIAITELQNQQIQSVKSTLHSNYLAESVELPPQTRLKRKLYYLTEAASLPYKLSIVIGGNMFVFEITK
jgi:hypothetical protein